MYEALVSAGGVALSPIPIAAMLVLLARGRGQATCVAFALGWTAGLAGAAVALVLLVQASGVRESSPRGLALAELVFGLVFLAVGAVLWLQRGQRAGPPRLIRGVENLTAPRSAALGLVLVVANPKVLALVLGAAVGLVGAGHGGAWNAWAVTLFVVIAATGVVLPLAAVTAFPDRAAMPLQAFRGWLGRHETVTLVLLALVVGTVFLASGARQLGS